MDYTAMIMTFGISVPLCIIAVVSLGLNGRKSKKQEIRSAAV
jgi:hypothetical protein